MTIPQRPRLRPVQIKRLQQQGRWYFHFHDHLALAGVELLVPLELRPALLLCDGEHDLATILDRVQSESGLDLGVEQLTELIDRLDDALLLEGERFERACAAALSRYRDAPFRAPALAGRAYPAEPSALTSQLMAYEMQAETPVLPAASVAGVLSPHIDYSRGGLVYAQGWRMARAAVRAATRVIVLGTDHCGSPGMLTLTAQRYATPWGTFGHDAELHDALAEALGTERSQREELHHRSEHSIELAAVWLHHVRGGKPVKMLPLLCGHPAPYLAGGIPGEDHALARALSFLRQAVAGGALVVVAGDLAHVGPVFGDSAPFRSAELALVREADLALVDDCRRGPNAVLGRIATHEDRYRICGLSPLAVALAIMPPVRLQLAAYAQCPADDDVASFVSIAGGCFVRADTCGGTENQHQ